MKKMLALLFLLIPIISYADMTLYNINNGNHYLPWVSRDKQQGFIAYQETDKKEYITNSIHCVVHGKDKYQQDWSYIDAHWKITVNDNKYFYYGVDGSGIATAVIIPKEIKVYKIYIEAVPIHPNKDGQLKYFCNTN